MASSGRNGILLGARVLVVEDDDDNAEMLAMVLELEGAQTQIASTADVAMMKIRAFRPHVLVSDIGLPGKDGYAFVRELRAIGSEDVAAIPAIALSGYSDPEHVERSLRAGFQLHVPKPIHRPHLIAHVARLAGRTVGT
jgi:CheY-like chemotaxis protein